jgi:hypothetical protein
VAKPTNNPGRGHGHHGHDLLELLWRFAYTSESGGTAVIIHKLNAIQDQLDDMEDKLDEILANGGGSTPKPATKMNLKFGKPT